MQSLVVFKHNEQEYPLTIVDANGEKWVPAEQVGMAIGHSNIRNLVKDLLASGEIQEGKHIRKVSLQMVGDTQPRKQTVFSLRGIIRTTMKAQTERAMAFRDHAETVLFDVMTTGEHVANAEASVDRKYRTASIVASTYQKLGKLWGVNESMTKAIAAEEIRRAVGLDFSPLLIENKVEEKPLTPTELGKLMNPVLSARAMNTALCENGYQIKAGEEWTPTEKGKPSLS